MSFRLADAPEEIDPLHCTGHGLLCMDGLTIHWPYSRARAISLTSSEVGALRHRCALVRILSHEALQTYQRAKLYHPDFGGTRHGFDRSGAFIRTARRIRATDTLRLCFGLGERSILAIFARYQTKRALVEALLTAPTTTAQTNAIDPFWLRRWKKRNSE